MSNVCLVGPDGVTPLSAPASSFASGNVANAAAVATIPAVVGRTNYLTGLEITAGGATAAALVAATVTGLLGGPLTYIFAAPAGVTVGALPLTVEFNPPLAGAAANTAIVVTLPALGAGNTNAAAVAHGYTV